MEDIISIQCGERTVYIGSLSRQTIIESEAEHMGAEGYFVFTDGPAGIDVLAKVVSFEAALRLADAIGS